MDEEPGYFLDGEQIDERQLDQRIQGIQSSMGKSQNAFNEQKGSSLFGWKAMNVEEAFKSYPPDLKKSLVNCSLKNRHIPGLKGIIGIPTKIDESRQFLESIDSGVFNSQQKDNYKNFPELFSEIKDQHSPQIHRNHQLQQLSHKIQEIQQKYLSGISMRKTIGKAFTEHFQNYLYFKEESTFLKQFGKSFECFLTQAKSIKTPGVGLITLTYEFWMKMFRDFVKQIWQHSEKYTLNLFKKQKISNGPENSICTTKSTISSSNNDGLEKQKRKGWSKSELQVLQKIIQANAVFSQSRLQQLAQQFDRTPSSISSKVQKILRARKKQNNNLEENNQDISIQAKIKYILQINPKGLSRQQIIQKISENYEMGIDDNWKNSVGSLLSSSQSFNRIKMPYRLINPIIYYDYAFSSTFKDKLIQCLLNIPKNEGDLKDITRQYIKNFCANQIQPNERKQLQSNISKTLSKYNIFERQNSKVLYQLNNGVFEQQNNLDRILMFS